MHTTQYMYVCMFKKDNYAYAYNDTHKLGFFMGASRQSARPSCNRTRHRQFVCDTVCTQVRDTSIIFIST